MEDDEIRARFDGRGHVEIRGPVAVKARAEEIAHALGYRLIATEESRGAGLAFGYRGPLSVRLVFRRDDDPRARRRAARGIERLRAGGPVLADDEPPPPPPPAPAPPLVPRPPAPRPRRPTEPQPPPPVPPGPRIPPRPTHPPGGTAQ